MPVVASTAPRSLTIIMSLRLYRSTMAPAMGETRRNGTMKQADTMPSAVALPVFWYTQIVRAKLLMFDASTDTSCPIQTMVNPAMLSEGPPAAFCFGFISPLRLCLVRRGRPSDQSDVSSMPG